MNIPEYLLSLSKKKDEAFCSVMDEMTKEMFRNPRNDVFNVLQKEVSEKKLTLSDYFGVITRDNNKILAGLREIANDAMDQNIQVITDRIKTYLDITPLFQKQKYWRLEIFIPFNYPRKEETGSNVYELMRKTGLWEFRTAKSRDSTFLFLTKIDKILGGTVNLDTSADKSSIRRQKIRNKEELEKLHPLLRLIVPGFKQMRDEVYTTENGKKSINKFLKKREIQKIIPPDDEIVFSASKMKGLYRLNYVSKLPQISIANVLKAESAVDLNTKTPVIKIVLEEEAAVKAEEIINSGGRIVVMLDGEIYISPVGVKPEGGKFEVGGFKSIEEAEAMSVLFNSGPLAAPMKLFGIGWAD